MESVKERMEHFNPRSYKRSDWWNHLKAERLNISIHAPTRGATMRKGTAVVCLEFQSTLLQEERPSRECGCTVSCRISIHAPTRGATVPLRAFHLG